MLATGPSGPMELPCPGWECYYRKPDGNYTRPGVDNPKKDILDGNYARPGVDNPQQDVRLDDDSSSPDVVLAKGPMDSESSTDRDEEPPTWSFECFDRENYCWLKKAL